MVLKLMLYATVSSQSYIYTVAIFMKENYKDGRLILFLPDVEKQSFPVL